MEYKTVKIGSQKWMCSDLKFHLFKNGDPIQISRTREEWYRNTKEKLPCMAYSKNFKDVVFYNYYAIIDNRNILPESFKIPAIDDVDELIEHLGSKQIAGLKLKSTDNELFEEVAYLEPEEKELKKKIGNSSVFSAVETGYKMRNGHESIGLSYKMWLLDKNNKPSIFILVEGDNQAFIENKTDLIINSGFVVRGIKK